VLQFARKQKWEALHEEAQISESDSVDRASCHIEGLGFGAVLRLPMDIPLVQPQDIEELLKAKSGEPGAVIAPSRDGTGTNALLRTPPSLFPSHFGPDSFRLHLAEAEARGVTVRVIRNPRIALDVDDADDLRALLRADAGASGAVKWLREHWPAERESPRRKEMTQWTQRPGGRRGVA
jgi:2-phospho-L-lactate guanylyltransferase